MTDAHDQHEAECPVFDGLFDEQLARGRLIRDRQGDAELRPVVSGVRLGRRRSYRVRLWGVFVDGVLHSTLHLRRDGRVQRSWPDGRETVPQVPPGTSP